MTCIRQCQAALAVLLSMAPSERCLHRVFFPVYFCIIISSYLHTCFTTQGRMFLLETRTVAERAWRAPASSFSRPGMFFLTNSHKSHIITNKSTQITYNNKQYLFTENSIKTQTCTHHSPFW